MSRIYFYFGGMNETNYLGHLVLKPRPDREPHHSVAHVYFVFCMHTLYAIKILGSEDHIERVILIKYYTDLLYIQFKNVEFH